MVSAASAPRPSPGRITWRGRVVGFLAKLCERAAECDRKGEALAQEHQKITGEIPGRALDAIERESKRGILSALRKRLAVLPGLIEAANREREIAARQGGGVTARKSHPRSARGQCDRLTIGPSWLAAHPCRTRTKSKPIPGARTAELNQRFSRHCRKWPGQDAQQLGQGSSRHTGWRRHRLHADHLP